MAELGMDALDGQMRVDANVEDGLDGRECEDHVQIIDDVREQHEDHVLAECKNHNSRRSECCDGDWGKFTEEEIGHICEAEREHRWGGEYIEEQLLRATIAESVDASSAGVDVEMEVGPSQPCALAEAMATMRHYEDTLADALNKYSDAQDSLREACAEIRELRAKLLVSERQTEHAQVKSNETWLDLTASRWEAHTLHEEVARLNCQAERLRTEMAKLEKDAEGSEQLLLEQLTAATATIALLEQQCMTAIKP
jgi:hypothetical protein